MASIRASNVTPSSFPSSSSRCRREMTARATINMPKVRNGSSLSLPKLTTIGLAEELQWRSDYKNKTTTQFEKLSPSPKVSDPMAMAKLYAIMEAVADRVEMHENIGEQRNNWNSLLLTSINSITLIASVMTGVAAMGAGGAPLVALKLSSTLLYLAATGMLLVMNKIQPSQLAEEQRNAARAYPLPLLGVMLEKFPKTVEPAVWWAPLRNRKAKGLGGRNNGNGWNGELEGEMREIVTVLNRKDKEDYLRLGKKALKLNKILAISGPLLPDLLLSALLSRATGRGLWSNAGFFELMQESIESNLKEREVERRENGELFEMKVALQLGRSLSELRDLATTSAMKGEANHEFASKLF
ncbi:hypothetical protein C3L33_06432, partial [Rhododendron williamsianum]